MGLLSYSAHLYYTDLQLWVPGGTVQVVPSIFNQCTLHTTHMHTYTPVVVVELVQEIIVLFVAE